MDIKWKKSKKIIGFLSFFLGISLFLGSLTGVLSLWTSHVSLSDAFCRDYQNTALFRSRISSYLEDFVSMGAGRKIHWSGNTYEADFFPPSYYFASTDEAATEASWEISSEELSEYYNETSFLPDQWNDYYQSDKNVLYQIKKGTETVYSNTGQESLDWASKTMPEGYNFLLWFNGEKVFVYKDGTEIDLYGDGFYRDDSDWFLPGYQNFQADPSLSRIQVLFAAAASPVRYINHSAGDYYENNNQLYWLTAELHSLRLNLVFCLVLAILGIVLFAVFFLLRRETKSVFERIGSFTGRLWFECKVLLLILAVWILLLPLVQSVGGYSYYYGVSISELFYEFSTYGSIVLLPVFWIIWLFLNDLRTNPKSWRHSIVTALVTRRYRLPVQKRLSRSSAALMILNLVPALFLLLVLAALSEPGMLALCAVLCLILFAANLFHLRYQFSLARDLGLLSEQVQAVRAGVLTQKLSLQPDSDLRELAEDVNKIQEGMREALADQMKSERMKVELITNVSHDIKTPLTSIISYAELLGQETGLPDYVMDYIQILKEKSERLKDMVQDVFEVSKASSGQLPVKLENLDLCKLLRQTLADMQERIRSSSVQIKTNIPEEPVLIFADGARLYRVFQNLIQNALQYSLDGSRVYLSLRPDSSRVSASIQNTSKTELPADVDFTERFVRGDKSRSDGGSGLGLSIARTFAEACGGTFQIHTIADLFTVTLTFPLADDSMDHFFDP